MKRIVFLLWMVVLWGQMLAAEQRPSSIWQFLAMLETLPFLR